MARPTSLGPVLLIVATMASAGTAGAQTPSQGVGAAPPSPPAPTTSAGTNPATAAPNPATAAPNATPQPSPSQPGQLPGAAPPSPPAPQPAQISCGAEATAQNLTGQARSLYVAECHRRRGDPPRDGSGTVLSTQRLPSGQPRVGRSRQECRQIARSRHLWGLARHKFLQRCRYGSNRRTPPPLNR